MDEIRVILSAGRSTKTERKAFIKRCPADDCRGFLSSQWKCGLCENICL